MLFVYGLAEFPHLNFLNLSTVVLIDNVHCVPPDTIRKRRARDKTYATVLTGMKKMVYSFTDIKKFNVFSLYKM